MHADDEHATLPTWHKFVSADVFVMGKSSLSITAAFLSSGQIFYPFTPNKTEVNPVPSHWLPC